MREKKCHREIFLAISEINLSYLLKTIKASENSNDENLYGRYEDKYEDLGKKYFNYKYKLKKNLLEIRWNWKKNQNLNLIN